jgi:uncharacterized lipoprotein YmbA
MLMREHIRRFGQYVLDKVVLALSVTTPAVGVREAWHRSDVVQAQSLAQLRAARKGRWARRFERTKRKTPRQQGGSG